MEGWSLGNSMTTVCFYVVHLQDNKNRFKTLSGVNVTYILLNSKIAEVYGAKWTREVAHWKFSVHKFIIDVYEWCS